MEENGGGGGAVVSARSAVKTRRQQWAKGNRMLTTPVGELKREIKRPELDFGSSPSPCPALAPVSLHWKKRRRRGRGMALVDPNYGEEEISSSCDVLKASSGVGTPSSSSASLSPPDFADDEREDSKTKNQGEQKKAEGDDEEPKEEVITFAGNTLTVDCKHLWMRTQAQKPCCQACLVCRRRWSCKGRRSSFSIPGDCTHCLKPHDHASFILKGINMTIRPGRFLAICGGSGSGKTSLMNECSGRTNGSTISSGMIYFNKTPTTAKTRRDVCAYVEQKDIMLTTMTARENIHFAARMGLPPSMSDAQIRTRTNDVLTLLGLKECADTIVGDPEHRGLSGGERKRVSIGMEVAKMPDLLCVDEPTSGLDVSTAYDIVHLLHSLTKQSKNPITVVCTIHTPSSKIFELFDDLLLIASGRVAYQGAAIDALQYFASIPGCVQCPDDCNEAEYLLKMLDIKVSQDDDEDGQQKKQERYDGIMRQVLGLAPGTALPLLPPNPDQAHHSVEHGIPEDLGQFKRHRQLPYLEQLKHLSKRSVLHNIREKRNVYARIAQNVGLAIYVMLLYLRLGQNQRSVNARVGLLFFLINMQALLCVVNAALTFTEEGIVYAREKASKLYHTSAYFLSKTMVDIPFQIFLTLVYATLVNFSVGLQSSGESFLKMVICLVMIANCAQSIGLLLAAVVPHALLAMTLCPICMVPCMLGSGFFIYIANIPNFLQFLVFLSPHRYIFEAAMINEFEGQTFYCDAGESLKAPSLTGPWDLCPIDNGQIVLDTFGMKVENFWPNIGASCLLFLGFRLLAYCVLRFGTNKK